MTFVHARPSAGGSALEALVDAAAGILAADSLEGTLGRIAHHLGRLLPYDDLTVYEVRGGTELHPVFAVGDWVAEIMAETLSVEEGVTGWSVRHRTTRNVPNTRHEPLCMVVAGTDDAAEAFVSVPLLAPGHVVGALNVYRTGADRAFSEAEVELVERFATMAALAYDSARQRDSLRVQASTDGLTGLFNHRSSQERLRREIAAAQDAGRPVGVVVVDLDHFKLVNDAFGHAEGDRVLVETAARLRASVRGGDAVGRLGGEEFVLILPGVDPDGARDAAERARAAVAEVTVRGRRLGCSAGVAAFPGDGTDAAVLLEHADAALYWAKRSGRGQTRRFGRGAPRRLSEADQRAEVEALLAAGPGAVTPVLQPLLELATGRVGGWEALARFPGDPARRPDEWFAQAHRAGLGAELEALALRAALATPGRPPGSFLAVNVSPGALLSDQLRAVLPADCSGLVLELTEHEAFGAEGDLEPVLRELRGRGARIALDDAGAGYAGLQQLIRVAPDILKLDRALVHGAHRDPSREALLQALITFAATTGAAVCGEGVEELDDLRVLAELDATYAQGYALARPQAGWPEPDPAAASATAATTAAGLRIPAPPRAGAASRAFAGLAGALAAARDQPGLAEAVGVAAALVGADHIGLFRVQPDGRTLERLTRGLAFSHTAWRMEEFPATDYVLRERTPGQLVLGDPAGDPAELAALEAVGMGTLLMVPVVFGDRAVAVLQAYRRIAQPFSSAEVDRARVVAQQLGAAMDRLAGDP